jgi:predicted transcriptional regulator
VTTQRTLLLSLRPQFADATLSGAKTVELRRRPINAQPPTPIILYASSPTMAIVGTARLGEVQIHTSAAAWRKHRMSLGLSRTEFDAYLDGSPSAYVLLLDGVCVLNEPLSLRQNDHRLSSPAWLKTNGKSGIDVPGWSAGPGQCRATRLKAMRFPKRTRPGR